MALDALLTDSARAVPDKTAVVSGDERVPWRTLDARATALARALVAHGVEPGARVAVCLDNGVPHVVALFAIWRAGACAVPLNPQSKPDKLVRLLRHSEARALIAGTRTLAALPDLEGLAPDGAPQAVLRVAVAGASDAVPEGALRYDALMTTGTDADAPASTPPSVTMPPVAARDLALLIYTSGSTGMPKGVMHTHGSLGAAVNIIVGYLENTRDDVLLQVLPLSFGYGLMQLLSMAHVGGTLVLEKSFAFPQVILKRIADERVTAMAVVPTIAALFLKNGMRAGGDHDVSRLRTITNAGAGMPVPLVKKMREALPHVRLVLMYGQTECIRASYLPAHEVDARPHSVGRGMPGQEHWLEDEHGARVTVGVGELVVRGPHVMKGYWQQPEETARKLRGGPITDDGPRTLHTGDLFSADEGGWLSFVARQDDVIKTRGEKVSPREVEEALLAVAGVHEAAVLGAPDELLGQIVVACVVTEGGAPRDERALLRACAQKLEEFAVPKRVLWLDALPRNDNGKIDKQALAQRIASAPSEGASSQGNAASGRDR